MGTYIVIEDVRRTSGDFEEKVSDTRIEAIIGRIEKTAEKWLNTKFVPTLRIETQTGNRSNQVMLEKNPVLSIRTLEINDTSVTPAYIKWVKESGRVRLTSDSEVSRFISADINDVIISYLYGWMQESSTSTATDAASTSGTSVALSVASESGFTTDDWVEVYGTDGNREVAQVTGTGTGEITIDQLVQAHVSGSVVVLLETEDNVKRYLEVECAIPVVTSIIGATATDITGHELGDLRVQKGEPYTQWRETLRNLKIERDELKKRIKPKFSIM